MLTYSDSYYARLTTDQAMAIMIDLYEKVTGTKATTKTQRGRSKTGNNPTIAAIASDFSGGRIRFIRRHEEQLNKKTLVSQKGEREKNNQTPSINEEMQKMHEYLEACYELMLSRNTKYGDSWKVLSIQSMANLGEMKLHRIANMSRSNEHLDVKILDELMDTINYCVFALYLYNNQCRK